MTSRERVLAAMRHGKCDRVPTDIWATEEVWAALVPRFGPTRRAVCDALHIDGIAAVSPAYAGPPVPAAAPGEQVDHWGIRTRRVSYTTGAYWEQSYFPLAGARTVADLDAYAWPRADWFDFSRLRDQARALGEMRVVECGYMAPFYFHNLLRGLEQSLVDPLDDPAFTGEILDRICAFFYDYHLRAFESCDGMIDVAQVTDDYGGQAGPLIGMETFREFYKPHLQRFIDLCHSFHVTVFHHDDGAIRPFLPELVQMGIDVLNPVQHTCPGMDREGLKRDFGARLCFHGGIDNQVVLPFGSEEEVRREVRRSIDTLASDGTGYILAPCHNLQAVSPVENILAMYDEAYNYGRF